MSDNVIQFPGLDQKPSTTQPIKLKTGRRLTEEDIHFLGEAFTKQLEQYVLNNGLGDIHAAFVLSHVAEAPGDSPSDLLGIQNGVIDIFGRGELKGTSAGDTLGGATVQCALQWAGQFLNHSEVVTVSESDLVPAVPPDPSELD